MTANRLLRYTL